VKTMAEEISLHSQIGRDEKGQYCTGCNHRYGYAAERGLNLQACEHVAAMLTAAGFGPVKAAQAEALRGAADDFGATYHGNWLRARADAIGVGK
jgi:hypothetical protein